MSEYGLALDFISKQEGGAEHKEAILAYVKEVVAESKERASKLREANAKLKRLSEVAGGTEEDLEKQVSDLQRQIKELATERDTLRTDKEKESKELESLRADKQKQEKETRIRTLSEKAGADYEAFHQLFGEMAVEIVGETITVKEADKSLSLDEYLQSQPAWKKAALFSGQEEKKQEDKRLPGAPPKEGGNKDNVPTVGDSYISARYSVDRFKKP